VANNKEYYISEYINFSNSERVDSSIFIEARISINGVIVDLKNAVQSFNNIYFDLNHYSYRQIFRSRVFRARRTGRESLWISKLSIPQSDRTSKDDEYIVIAIYLSTEIPVEKCSFERRLKYISRRIEEFAERDQATRYHYFIYFCGYGFRAGVYEALKKARSSFIRDGVNANIRLIDLRTTSIRETIYRDLSNYLNRRLYGALTGDFSKSRNMVYGALKAFIDYLLMVLAHLKRDNSLATRLEDIARLREFEVDKYREIIESLAGPPKPVKERSAAATGIERSSDSKTELVIKLYGNIDNSEDLEEEEEVVDDRFERVEDVEVL